MQLDFEGVGFKLRIPIYNRDGIVLRLRTAVIPLTENDLTQNIKIEKMLLIDDENICITAFQNDIEPSEIELNDSRKTINAVFGSVEDKGDTKYNLTVFISNLSTNQEIQVYYVFNVGSTIATFIGVNVEENRGGLISEPEVSNEEVEDVPEPEVSNEEVEDVPEPLGPMEEPEEDETDFSDSPEDSTADDAIAKATKLLWIANKQIEEAAVKLLDRDSRIAYLEAELRKTENVNALHEEIERLESEIKLVSSNYINAKKETDEYRQKATEARARMRLLEVELRKAKTNPPLPPISELEKHLNDIVEYMESTAKSAGLSLENICVRTSMKEGKRHVNVYGEIRFAEGRNRMSSGCTIKASLYDASGKIEIEGSQYVSSSFKGYDTFNIGWNGGTDSSWLARTRIRLFVV